MCCIPDTGDWRVVLGERETNTCEGIRRRILVDGEEREGRIHGEIETSYRKNSGGKLGRNS